MMIIGTGLGETGVGSNTGCHLDNSDHCHLNNFLSFDCHLDCEATQSPSLLLEYIIGVLYIHTYIHTYIYIYIYINTIFILLGPQVKY
jgi:hypothetical protein